MNKRISLGVAISLIAIGCAITFVLTWTVSLNIYNSKISSADKYEGVYEKLLTNPDEKVEGTVKELADKYELTVMEMTGFLDGINDSLIEPNPIEEMEEDTKVSLAFDKEKLYKNMVDAKADWLYNLPMWDDIFDKETQKALYLEQKKSGTVIVGKKVGRNDPCPCGSGRKYKQCCGK